MPKKYKTATAGELALIAPGESLVDGLGRVTTHLALLQRSLDRLQTEANEVCLSLACMESELQQLSQLLQDHSRTLEG